MFHAADPPIRKCGHTRAKQKGLRIQMADDTRSEISWSELSDTDAIMFSVLSNAERTDLSRIPKASFATTSATAVAPIYEEEEEPRLVDVTYEDAGPSEEPNPYDDPCTGVIKRETTTAFDSCAIEHEPLQMIADDLDGQTKDDHPTKNPATDYQVPDRPVFAYSTNEDEELQKRSVLLDLQQLSMQNGVKLTKEWTMNDRVEDMLLEMRRHSLAQDEKANVNMMRDGMRMFITGIEMLNNKIGLLDLDGWSTDVCRDLNKHDANLARIYRKYWRRGNNNSPEMSIALSLFGSMGMHHLRRTMSKNLVNKAQQRSFTARNSYRHKQKFENTDSSDDEAPPGET